MVRTNQFYIVLVTCSSIVEARKIAQTVVKERLAACVNIPMAPLESIYRWKGKLEKAREHLLIIKTSASRLKALERKVLTLHSYETPEFIALPISDGSHAYLSWVSQALAG